MGENLCVTIYTDGSCLGNPGAGGWAVILKKRDGIKKISGGAARTTNNRMELTAAIRALQLMAADEIGVLYTDSTYVCNAINQHWIEGWRRNGWCRKDGELANADLWQELYDLLKSRNCRFQWVKGHAGDAMNEECDKMAKQQSAYYEDHGDEKSEILMEEEPFQQSMEEPAQDTLDYRVMYINALAVLDKELCSDSRRYMGKERPCGECIYCDFCPADEQDYPCGRAYIQQQTVGRRV